MKKYQYWVFKILFYVAFQMAAMIGALFTMHETVFIVNIEEEGDRGHTEKSIFTFKMAEYPVSMN